MMTLHRKALCWRRGEALALPREARALDRLSQPLKFVPALYSSYTNFKYSLITPLLGMYEGPPEPAVCKKQASLHLEFLQSIGNYYFMLVIVDEV